MSSGVSSPALGGCASTRLTLGTRWSPSPSSSSWAFSSPSPLTLSSPVPPPIALMTWWFNSPSSPSLISPTCLSTLVRRYSLRLFLFLDKMDF
ncbi:hypothetical protein BHM03_00011687 [Ensete ventricosum]|nr:hypothetical protein BHM03_00011687 [Ensete ventricosum]